MQDLLRLTSLMFLLTLSITAQADVLRIPISHQGHTSIKMPVHGDQQTQVIQQFGEPRKRYPSVGQPRAGVNLEIKRRETIPCTYTHMRISENPSAKMESWMPGGRGARGCMGEITWRGGRQNKELVGADNPDRMKP